jgi:hypothetical protein
MDQAKLVEDPYDPLDWEAQRNNASSFLRMVGETVNSALGVESASFVTAKDRLLLEVANRNLRHAFEQIDKSFIAPNRDNSPAHAAFGYEMLWRLISAVFVAGSRGDVSESVRSYVTLDETTRRQPAQMRAAKQDKNKARRAALADAILATVGGDINALSSYRDKMRPTREEVMRHLSGELATGSWPSTKTVRDEIMAIRREAKPQKI